MVHIAIILPAYNEELTVAETMEGFYRELPTANIIVVNNNSNDQTGAVARQALARMGARGCVIDEFGQGKGNAVRRAFMDVDADIYIMADADQTYPPDAVHKLIEPIAGNRADMVVGDRLSGGGYRRENKRRFHSIGNEIVSFLVNKLFSANLSDIMSGYRVFSRRFVKNYPILVSGFQLETDMTLHALDKRFRILEIPVAYKDRPDGSLSKLNTFTDGTRVLFTIAQILRHYRPLWFFGAAAVVLGSVGLLTAIPVISDWIQYRYIYHVPLAVLSAALELLAALALSVGLILDSIAHQHRMKFERDILGFEKTPPLQ